MESHNFSKVSGGLDTRLEARRLSGGKDRTFSQALGKSLMCIVFALVVLQAPEFFGWDIYDNLSPAGKATWGIMLLAGSLWASEAIPAFAVGIMIVGLEILILGKQGGVYAAEGDAKAWQEFVLPWSSPLMWLFLGGFVLAAGISRAKLDLAIMRKGVSICRGKPKLLLLSLMAIVFVFSMFMSNTATTAMAVAVVLPLMRSMPPGEPYRRALALGVPIAANIGGMGSVIGTPPNAIAVGALQKFGKFDFLDWMKAGLPPALILFVLGYFYLIVFYRFSDVKMLLSFKGEENDGFTKKAGDSESENIDDDDLEKNHVMAVWLTFLVTVGMWMTESWHHISTAVSSFIPIVVFSMTGVLRAKDVRKLPWDVLLLLFGGLSLGAAVKHTGVDIWIAGFVPAALPLPLLAVVFCILCVILSNLMSNTATASVLLPVALGIASSGIASSSGAAGSTQLNHIIISSALACSCAMILPISTPPNVIAYSTGELRSRDFIIFGSLLGLVGAGVCWLWTFWLFH